MRPILCHIQLWLSNRGFQDQEGFHSLQHLPETYGFHPPRTEILQLLLSLDWTAGQGSQLQPQHQVSKQSFIKKRKKTTN